MEHQHVEAATWRKLRFLAAQFKGNKLVTRVFQLNTDVNIILRTRDDSLYHVTTFTTFFPVLVKSAVSQHDAGELCSSIVFLCLRSSS